MFDHPNSSHTPVAPILGFVPRPNPAASPSRVSPAVGCHATQRSEVVCPGRLQLSITVANIS